MSTDKQEHFLGNFIINAYSHYHIFIGDHCHVLLKDGKYVGEVEQVGDCWCKYCKIDYEERQEGEDIIHPSAKSIYWCGEYKESNEQTRV